MSTKKRYKKWNPMQAFLLPPSPMYILALPVMGSSSTSRGRKRTVSRIHQPK